MTIRNKILSAGAIIFVVLVVLASMNMIMHLKVRHNLEIRDQVNQRLAVIEEHAKWANDLKVLVSDIVASGRVPDFSSHALEPSFEIGKGTSRILLEQATALRPSAALDLAAQHPGQIDLLITDVIMPEMNGKRLSDAILKLRPGMRALFMSGYRSNVIAHHGVLEENVEFLEKPYSRRGLLERVRDVLDQARPNDVPL